MIFSPPGDGFGISRVQSLADGSRLVFAAVARALRSGAYERKQPARLIFGRPFDIRRQIGCGRLARSLLLRFSLAVGLVTACAVVLAGNESRSAPPDRGGEHVGARFAFLRARGYTR